MHTHTRTRTRTPTKEGTGKAEPSCTDITGVVQGRLRKAETGCVSGLKGNERLYSPFPKGGTLDRRNLQRAAHMTVNIVGAE